jgi:hypothetical protein
MLPPGTPRGRLRLGSWTLPSGNNCIVHLDPTLGFIYEWDDPPSPAWPKADLEYYKRVVFPAALQAAAELTGETVMGVQLG